jgi:hypothetical protein
MAVPPEVNTREAFDQLDGAVANAFIRARK